MENQESENSKINHTLSAPSGIATKLQQAITATEQEIAILLELEASKDTSSLAKSSFINALNELPHFNNVEGSAEALVTQLIESERQGAPKYLEKITALQKFLDGRVKDLRVLEDKYTVKKPVAVATSTVEHSADVSSVLAQEERAEALH